MSLKSSSLICIDTCERATKYAHVYFNLAFLTFMTRLIPSTSHKNNNLEVTVMIKVMYYTQTSDMEM